MGHFTLRFRWLSSSPGREVSSASQGHGYPSPEGESFGGFMGDL